MLRTSTPSACIFLMGEMTRFPPETRFSITSKVNHRGLPRLFITAEDSYGLLDSPELELVKYSSTAGAIGRGKILDPCWIHGKHFPQVEELLQ